MDKETLLKKVELFSGLDSKALRSIAELCFERAYRRGDTLVSQGDSGIGLYIIASGRVKVVKETASGASLELATHGPGEFFGEITVLDGAPRSASVVAAEDTVCHLLTSWQFKAAMEVHPEIALGILPVVVRRFRETSDRLLAVTGDPPRESRP